MVMKIWEFFLNIFFLKIFLSTNDNREFKIYAADSSSDFDSGKSASDELCLNSHKSIDGVLFQYCSDLFDIFPSMNIK